MTIALNRPTGPVHFGLIVKTNTDDKVAVANALTQQLDYVFKPGVNHYNGDVVLIGDSSEPSREKNCFVYTPNEYLIGENRDKSLFDCSDIYQALCVEGLDGRYTDIACTIETVHEERVGVLKKLLPESLGLLVDKGLTRISIQSSGDMRGFDFVPPEEEWPPEARVKPKRSWDNPVPLTRVQLLFDEAGKKVLLSDLLPEKTMGQQSLPVELQRKITALGIELEKKIQLLRDKFAMQVQKLTERARVRQEKEQAQLEKTSQKILDWWDAGYTKVSGKK